MTNAPTPLSLPQSGGCYIRLADGSLVLTEEPTMDAAVVVDPKALIVAEALVETWIKPPVKAPVKSPVKEA